MNHFPIYPVYVLIFFSGVIQDTEPIECIYPLDNVANHIPENNRDVAGYRPCLHTSGLGLIYLLRCYRIYRTCFE